GHRLAVPSGIHGTRRFTQLLSLSRSRTQLGGKHVVPGFPLKRFSDTGTQPDSDSAARCECQTLRLLTKRRNILRRLIKSFAELISVTHDRDLNRTCHSGPLSS